MFEFQVDGKKFKGKKIDAFKQVHLLRRMGTLVPTIITALGMKDKDPVLALSYVVASFSRLSDDDSDFIIKTCLGSCQVQQAANLWVDIVSVQGDPMFDGFNLQMILQITWEVLKANFGPFTHVLLSMVLAIQKEKLNSSNSPTVKTG